MSVAPEKTLTPDEFLVHPDTKSYELVDGQLVDRGMGYESSYVGGELLFLLKAHVRTQRLGWVAPADAGFQCFPDAPEKVRKPDVSFVRADRMRSDSLPKGWVRMAPDLAAEVVSPNELFADVVTKADEYLAAGVALVWVIDPATERVHVYYPDGRGRILSSADELDGADVVPGFRCKVAELFRPPKGVT